MYNYKKEIKMKQETINPTVVACYELTTNLIKIGEAVGVIPQQIIEEVARQGLEVAGDQIWEYQGCDGDPQKNFTLKITVPVNTKGSNTENIVFTELPPFKCITHVHEGAWSEFPEVYQNLMQEMTKEGLGFNGVNREIYRKCDFENPANCITELQIGIQ